MIVYLARNQTNGKCYVGKTKRTLLERMQEHQRFARLGSPQPLHRAIRKHGFEAFTWSELANVECTDEELNQLEVRFIAEWGTFGSQGYNATRGGDGVVGLKHSEETKVRMSEARKGEKNPNWGGLSEEHKKNLAKAKVGTGIGPRPHTQGRKRSDEIRAKISTASATYAKVPTPVCRLDNENRVVATYRSMSEAAKTVNGWGSRIKACCEGRQETYRDCRWRYADNQKGSQ